MIKLAIVKKDNFVYHLKSEDNKEYKINIEFHDLISEPTENDVICMNEELLSEPMLAFGATESEYGREIKSSSDKDLVILIMNNNPIYLKRLYG